VNAPFTAQPAPPGLALRPSAKRPAREAGNHRSRQPVRWNAANHRADPNLDRLIGEVKH
jgi:hypothetical protein